MFQENAHIAQLAEACALEAQCWGFDSLYGYHKDYDGFINFNTATLSSVHTVCMFLCDV